jgi:hypothetical protein
MVEDGVNYRQATSSHRGVRASTWHVFTDWHLVKQRNNSTFTYVYETEYDVGVSQDTNKCFRSIPGGGLGFFSSPEQLSSQPSLISNG